MIKGTGYLCLIAIHQKHPCACFDESLDNREAYARCSARDDSNFVGQVKHGGGAL